MLEIIGGILVAVVAYVIGYGNGRGAKIDDADALLQPPSPHKKCWWCRQVKPAKTFLTKPEGL